MISVNAADPVALQQPRLLDRVRDKIRVKHYSIRTEHAYLDWVRRFIVFHGRRHPREMGAPEVEAFLTHKDQRTNRIARHGREPCKGWW